MFQHPLDLLPISKQKLNQFYGKGLTSIEDLAFFFPRKYIDFRTVTSATDVVFGEYYAMSGTVSDTRASGSVFTATIEEDTPLPSGYRPKFYVTWFGSNYHISKLTIGESWFFCGRVSSFRGQVQMTAPLIYTRNRAEACVIHPVYSAIQGMSRDYLRNSIDMAVNYLKESARAGDRDLFADSLGLMPKFEAIAQMHQPTDNSRFRKARARIAFEEIYSFYEELRRKDLYLIGTAIGTLTKDAAVREVISSLPFELTEDQERVITCIMEEAKAGRRLHSLVSGDVGCGKTMVAILSAIFMWENGYQTIVMAPTLVLASQHYNEFCSFAEKLGIRVGLLTTETKKRDRRQLLADFSGGGLDILIGTHSVLGDEITPNRLGLTIIDEEHKFGVRQKSRLEEFDRAGVHHLSMTATPIPRSIAMSVYGRDLAVLPIRTMPKGRLPVVTEQCTTPDPAFEKIYQEVLSGRQGYIVCPFIEDSESAQFKDVISVSAAKKLAADYFKNKPQPVRLGVISGDMKQGDIIDTVNRFAAGEFDVLLSTTIIEVGVNIPNASVIAIMSAERFGLAALHQLRGRVGRGRDQGHCLLCSPVPSDRLDIMCNTADGFSIAEHDMRLRGPGDLSGEAQSGDSQVIDLIIKRPKLASAIRRRLLS